MYNQIKLLLISVFTLLVSQKIKPYVDGKVTDALTQAANTAQDKADAAQQAAETFATNADAALLLTVNQNIQTAVAAAANDIDKQFDYVIMEWNAPSASQVNDPGYNIKVNTFKNNILHIIEDLQVNEKAIIRLVPNQLSQALAGANEIHVRNLFLVENNGDEFRNLPVGGSYLIQKTAANDFDILDGFVDTFVRNLVALRTLSQTQIAQVITDLGQLQTAHNSLNTNFSNFLLQYQEFQTDYAAKQQEQDDAIAALDLKFGDYLTAAQVNSLISESQTEIMSQVGIILGV